jgi:hypothetical protein
MMRAHVFLPQPMQRRQLVAYIVFLTVCLNLNQDSPKKDSGLQELQKPTQRQIMRMMNHLGSISLCSLILVGGLSGCGGGSDSAANPIPSAQADTYDTLSWNEAKTLDVLGNDTVSGNGTLNLVSVTTPGHGTAQITGNKIVYTPAANFFGQDSFSYTVNGATGGATVTANVNVTVNAKMTFSGKATDEPLANATMTIKVGTNSYTAVTDAQGNYSIPVASSSPDNFISITAQGSGTQSHVKLVSLVGDSQTAATAAGTDSTVVAGELPGVNVTNVTTALYAQVTQLNNGAVPTTQSSLDAATSRVSGEQLLQMAAMIKLVADTGTGIALPSGATDTLALVTSADTYNQFAQTIVQQEPAKLAATVSAILADPNLSSAPASTVETSKSLIYYIGKGCCAFGAMELVLNPDGTASTVEGDGKHQATWAKANNAITVTYAQPVIASGFDIDQYATRVSTNSLQIRQFTGTQESGVSSITFGGTVTYPGGEKPTREMSAANGDIGTYTFGALSRFGAPAAGELAGSTYAGFTNFVLNASEAIDQYSLTFAADGTAQSPELPGIGITWKIEGGKLVLAYSNGTKQTISRLSAASDGEEHWLIRAGNASGDYALGEAMVVKVQAGLAFTDSTASSRWLSSVNAGIVADSQFYINLMSNHGGQQEVAFLNGTVQPGLPIGWQVEAGKLAMRTYWLPNNTYAGSCPTGQTCTLVRERKWTLLRGSGNTIYVFELLTSGGFSQYRINRYDKSGT